MSFECISAKSRKKNVNFKGITSCVLLQTTYTLLCYVLLLSHNPLVPGSLSGMYSICALVFIDFLIKQEFIDLLLNVTVLRFTIFTLSILGQLNENYSNHK